MVHGNTLGNSKTTKRNHTMKKAILLALTLTATTSTASDNPFNTKVELNPPYWSEVQNKQVTYSNPITGFRPVVGTFKTYLNGVEQSSEGIHSLAECNSMLDDPNEINESFQLLEFYGYQIGNTLRITDELHVKVTNPNGTPGFASAICDLW